MIFYINWNHLNLLKGLTIFQYPYIHNRLFVEKKQRALNAARKTDQEAFGVLKKAPASSTRGLASLGKAHSGQSISTTKSPAGNRDVLLKSGRNYCVIGIIFVHFYI